MGLFESNAATDSSSGIDALSGLLDGFEQGAIRSHLVAALLFAVIQGLISVPNESAYVNAVLWACGDSDAESDLLGGPPEVETHGLHVAPDAFG